MAKEALIPAAVLITGASSGIGEALAREYAAPGRFLALCGQNKERLKNVAMACRSFGAEVEAKIVDVMDRDATRHWIKKIDAGHPPIWSSPTPEFRRAAAGAAKPKPRPGIFFPSTWPAC